MRVKLFSMILVILVISLFIISCTEKTDDESTEIDIQSNENSQKTTDIQLSPGIYRSFSKETANIDEEILVTLKIKIDGSSFYIVDEKIPEGATAYEPSSDGSTEDKGHVKWVVIQGAQDSTYTYKIKFTKTGENLFNGEYIFESMGSTPEPIKGVNSIIVQ